MRAQGVEGKKGKMRGKQARRSKEGREGARGGEKERKGARMVGPGSRAAQECGDAGNAKADLGVCRRACVPSVFLTSYICIGSLYSDSYILR